MMVILNFLAAAASALELLPHRRGGRRGPKSLRHSAALRLIESLDPSVNHRESNGRARSDHGSFQIFHGRWSAHRNHVRKFSDFDAGEVLFLSQSTGAV